MAKKSAKNEPKVRVTVCLDPVLWRKMIKSAERFGHSRSNIVEAACEEFLSDLALMDAVGLCPERIISVAQFLGFVRQNVDEEEAITAMERIGVV